MWEFTPPVRLCRGGGRTVLVVAGDLVQVPLDREAPGLELTPRRYRQSGLPL